MKEKIERTFADAPSTSKEADKGLLALRIGLGIFFILHGLDKFFGFGGGGGIDGFAGYLNTIGFPVAYFWAYLVAFVELFGGIAILLGFLTRASALFLAVIPLTGFILKGFSLTTGSTDILAFAGAFALLLAGPGKISFSETWFREETANENNGPTKEDVKVKENQDEKTETSEKTEKNEKKQSDEKETETKGQDKKGEKDDKQRPEKKNKEEEVIRL